MLMINMGDAGPTRPRKNGIGAALDSARHLATLLNKFGNSHKAMKKYQNYVELTYVRDNHVVDFVMHMTDFIINHELPRRAVIFLNDNNLGLLSRATRSTIEHILTGKSPYWRIPLDVLRETFLPPSDPGAEGY